MFGVRVLGEAAGIQAPCVPLTFAMHDKLCQHLSVSTTFSDAGAQADAAIGAGNAWHLPNQRQAIHGVGDGPVDDGSDARIRQAREPPENPLHVVHATVKAGRTERAREVGVDPIHAKGFAAQHRPDFVHPVSAGVDGIGAVDLGPSLSRFARQRMGQARRVDVPIQRIPPCAKQSGSVEQRMPPADFSCINELHLDAHRPGHSVVVPVQASLFRRAVRQVFLTDAGKLLLESTQSVFLELGRAFTQFKGEARVFDVSVAATTYVAARWLSPRIASFSEQHPDVAVSFQHSVNSADFNLQTVAEANQSSPGQSTPRYR